jgi:hypothetical protein
VKIIKLTIDRYVSFLTNKKKKRDEFSWGGKWLEWMIIIINQDYIYGTLEKGMEKV